MIHSIFALALLSTAAAFTNVRVASKSSNIVMMAEKSKSLPFMPQPANIVGMAGDVGFDPLGFSDFFDIRWLREAELKHARICMLAVTGFVASEFFQLPGEMHHVSPVAAHDAAVQSGAMSQILMWTGMFELLSTRVVSDMMDKENPTDRAPGDFMFDPLKFSEGKSDKVKADFALKELQNGRLAMLAFSGIVTEAVITGKAFPYI